MPQKRSNASGQTKSLRSAGAGPISELFWAGVPWETIVSLDPNGPWPDHPAFSDGTGGLSARCADIAADERPGLILKSLALGLAGSCIWVSLLVLAYRPKRAPIAAPSVDA